jgi:chemotaxis protein methyltransferase CheR
MALEVGKEYLVESRLVALARRAKLGGLREVFDTLRRQPRGELARQVVEALTTNETSFFRDEEPFVALRDVVLPDLVRRRSAERTLRIWCAASSSGQEPFSLAMLLREEFAFLDSWALDLSSSDLSREMLDRCQKATYSELEVSRGLSPGRRTRHFDPVGSSYRLKPEVRSMVRFFELNLAGPWPSMPPQDVVLMRNVLIYFDVPKKKEVLGKVKRLLRPDGYLFLGGSETTFLLDDGFVRESSGRVAWYRVR